MNVNEARPTEIGRTASLGTIGSLGSVLYLMALGWAAGIASFPLNDNSFFTHLATGRIILDQGSVPSSDPYTFTARGEPWTVQSWLASVMYAGFERLGGEIGLRLLILMTYAVAMTILWKLSAPAEAILARLVVMVGALLVVTDLWSERPYMVGVIGVGLVWLALEDRMPSWLLVPYMWIWVNSHGSFPLALALVAAVLVGTLLDRRRVGLSSVGVEVRVLKWTAVGTAAGAIGPLGFDALLFPMKAISASSSFGAMVEWNAPRFETMPERAFLVLLLAAFVAATVLGRWSRTLPLIFFAAAALAAQRNIVLAVMVFTPIIAEAVPNLGSLRSNTKPVIGVPVATALGLLVAVTATSVLLSPVTAFGGYPARALGLVAVAGDSPIEHRTATEDFTGNLLGLLDGPRQSVFIDDRVDMFPSGVFDDYLTLVQGGVGWDRVLDRYDIMQVVWSRERPLSSLLASSPEWHVHFSDAHWILARRRAPT